MCKYYHNFILLFFGNFLGGLNLNDVWLKKFALLQLSSDLIEEYRQMKDKEMIKNTNIFFEKISLTTPITANV